ncbi:UDP-N-acetylmuramoyl-L-alanyl-D-glutamate--2,6-diaminopimelate ligase [Paraliobacillus zengyii]|uniref:UDP-N-acetylmuramoyl-L-alanyl-D-glutamate--2, 6-diaminopimelate ligase n=1 Tax=Paraliobacillus zengyii TaxID=2213194 RepID=UPI000DD4E5AE|nr:UDP-N-acetylmuramoyl-L-alanyl-D-glutamate--2,6-diaminopimelate ligase [Paraliobacillus zengyii]
MKLLNLLSNIKYKQIKNQNLNEIEIHGIAESSSEVKPGFIFVAIKGYRSDGHDYIEDAIKNGASIIIGEKQFTDLSVPFINVSNSRKALAVIAGNFYGNPSHNKIMIAITGTNGKTTTSYLVKHILESNGMSCGLVGTIETIINGESNPSINTTPGSLTLNRLLYESNDQVIILEASSHGLLQYRLEGINFDSCLFLNLSHEHLDYHDSIEEYFETKATLFQLLKENGQAIINTDDSWGAKLNERLQLDEVNTSTIGKSATNDYCIEITGQDGSFKIKREGRTEEINPSMKGIHNIYNSSMAYAVAHQLGANERLISKSLKNFPGVDGRFQVFPQQNGANVVVDYAHTTDAFYHCLHTAKVAGAKRIVHIFGFRGNRDKTKRKDMLEITAKLSDQYLLTLDDLNTVPLEDMIETLENIHNTIGNHKGLVIPDRTLAIQQAMVTSQNGDWIIITGKGHEPYQQSFSLPTKSDKETVTYLTE